MKIAVIIEGSTKTRANDVMSALEGTGHEVYNLGMKNQPDEPDLTYIETGFLTALLLNMKAVDFVVGGCGTGQGYMNMVLQFPGVACGIIADPVDAFLFSKVNAGNCISLPLNKGYGNLAGDLNVKFVFEKLFGEGYGGGYPAARRDIQIGARKRLADFSLAAHRSMPEILKQMDREILTRTFAFPGVADFIRNAPDSDLKKCVLELMG